MASADMCGAGGSAISRAAAGSFSSIARAIRPRRAGERATSSPAKRRVGTDEHGHADRLAPLEHEAALGQRARGPSSAIAGSGARREAISNAPVLNEGIRRWERRAFREHHDRVALRERGEALLHHLHDARAVAAPQLDVFVEPHVPADARDAEVLDLRDPLVVGEQPEQHEDVEQRQVIGDHHVGFVARDLLAPAHRDRPGRIRPRVQRRPEAGEQVQDPQAAVERARHRPDDERDREQRNRRRGQERPEQAEPRPA